MNRFSIPEKNRGLILSPPLKELPKLIEENSRALEDGDVSIDGVPLKELRNDMKESLGIEGIVFASGHQPKFYGPGPFCKELVLEKLCSKFNCLNVLVDTDSSSKLSFEVPLTSNGVHIFQELIVKQFEEKRAYLSILGPSEEEFEGMRDKTLSRLNTLNSVKYYKQASGIFEKGKEVLSGRNNYVDWFRSFKNIYFHGRFKEKRLSKLVGCEAFQNFINEIKSNYSRFRGIYNEVLNDYGKKYGNLPATILEKNELPFWMIDSEGVRSTAKLSDLDSSPEPTGERLIAPKGLLLTMFCRMVVCDVFIHGIGGSRYSRATDQILTRFFGMDPPHIIVTSMTVYLEDEITESGVGSKGGESIDKRALKKRDYPFFIYPISQLKSVVMDRTGEVL